MLKNIEKKCLKVLINCFKVLKRNEKILKVIKNIKNSEKY